MIISELNKDFNDDTDKKMVSQCCNDLFLCYR